MNNNMEEETESQSAASEQKDVQSLVDDDEETSHFLNIVDAFKYYRTHALKKIKRSERHFSDLPKDHQARVPNFKKNLSQIRTCIDHNYEVIKLFIEDVDGMFENGRPGTKQGSSREHKVPSEFDMDKLRTTLKQIVRDWTIEGTSERQQCYTPILQQITKLFPAESCRAADVQVLVPGAGLGRLAFEIASLGYSCQGNEFSLFMLFVSNFILNKSPEKNIYRVYPWVHQTCNVTSLDNQLQAVSFPDVNPSELEATDASFSMAAGDFLEIYTQPDTWDCVVTVFFLDTAHNVIQYLETIYNILKPGGFWINLGPLLYHFADSANENSIELTYEDLRQVVLSFGFEILEEKTNLPATYTQNPHSMLKYQYECVFLVVQKPKLPTTSVETL